MDVDFGPLAKLIGVWKGDKGLDIAPDPEGIEENPFYETIEFTAVGDVKNAESQVLAVVRYTQEVYRKSDDTKIHDQTGYWLWDAHTREIIHSIAIPRGVCLVAGGRVVREDENGFVIEASASAEDPNYSIVEAPFMSQNASTKKFDITVKLTGETLHYKERTLVDIYGKKSFEHTDENRLQRV